MLCKPILFEPSLDNEFVWDWSNSFWLFSEEFDGMSFTWLLIDSLDIDVGASGLGVLDGSVVSNNTVEETLTRFGVLDVFNADIDTFWDDTSTNLLVDDDTDGSLGNVENTSSGTVVDLVWHTLLESTITLDIDDISLSVTGEVSLQTNCSLLTEVLGEHVTGTTSNTFWVCHFVRFCLSVRQSKSDSKMG